MDRKKNIIYITGKDAYGIELETERLVGAFRMRQDAQSIDSYHIEDIRDWSLIRQDMQTMSLFAEKRLFVLRGEIRMKDDDEEGDEAETQKKPKQKVDDILTDICASASEDTFIIFSGVTLTPKSSLLAWLDTHADIRKYDDIWSPKVWSARYPTLDSKTIETIIGRYQTSMTEYSDASHMSHHIGQAFEKLSILAESRALRTSDYDESVESTGSAKMYDFSDAILTGNGDRGLKIFHTMMETMNIYAFVASFLGLIRTSMYVKYLKYHGKSLKEIGNIITAHSFVIQKAYDSRVSYEKLYDFYESVISLNKAYRSGRGKKNPELGMIFDIELAIIGLKK